MTELMIAARKEARLRSYGRRYELRFVLSNAAAADLELEHVFYADEFTRAMACGPADPEIVIRARPGCR